ncbi:ammonium transporter [Rhodospirillum rubrum]|uniref:Ammonium transporter n=2 Tax=Rhodospirillum rubrum TaxID=1085 RepID=Q2RVB5_RHORT|nr:ammonium transporter [Rhodospirillum rubrum]AAK00343.1 ammonium transporter AmtB1 [Rhodospirillum rubrum]ABC21930.1 Ammonium transporter [Rhodospirillum rubrum ATCC 11170]AEO47634.1 ammonium transporter [Rhodospirillum rubrum F11]MBK5953496.1 ammonia channel protein [Rhodospirillum rubrum]HAQ00467.1 ammonium transporter [Rhodospirillum rubrum]
MMRAFTFLPAALVALLAPALAYAQDAAPTLDSGNTAWMLTSTALVLLMTIPGLALFYAGMVRKKNVLATMMQSFIITALVSVVWMVAGYSIAFGTGNAYFGDFSKFLLSDISIDSLNGTFPETVFVVFQMTFAIITPALITGAFAERMKFSAMLWFIGLWVLIVYAPICHWVWSSSGFLFNAGVLDYAGGTVVHINAGVAGLVCALVLRRRAGFGSENMAPYNLSLAVIGAALLWVGWFGFNAGSAVAADGRAGMAMLATQLGAAGATLSWIAAEWLVRGKPSVLGAVSGAVAGLVAITPASGFVLPGGALVIGLVAGVVCFWGATWLKKTLGYDDSLDAFGVHGIGGLVGALLTGVFAAQSVGGEAAVGLLEGNPGQVLTQAWGCLATIVWTAVASYVILKVIDLAIGLRVSPEQESEGLDISLHGERLQ